MNAQLRTLDPERIGKRMLDLRRHTTEPFSRLAGISVEIDLHRDPDAHTRQQLARIRPNGTADLRP